MKRIGYAVLLSGLVLGVWSAYERRSRGQEEPPCSPENARFFSADVNRDGALDISDAVAMLNYLFSGGRAPLCLAEVPELCESCDGRFAALDHSHAEFAEISALSTRMAALESRVQAVESVALTPAQRAALTGGGSADGLHTHSEPLGSSPQTAGDNAREILASGAARGDGNYWIDPDGNGGEAAYLTYADMTTLGGGWTMVYNSVLGTDTTSFWRILYAERLGRKGIPGLDTNFYDGSVYRWGREYIDVIEDPVGHTVLAMHATATDFDLSDFHFSNPMLVAGNAEIFLRQFASGWTAVDFDADTSGGNCAGVYCGVTQHYSACSTYNLGCDQEDPPVHDGGTGPHVLSSTLLTLGLTTDGTASSRVRRITRYAR
jgi:hypothetical protein